MSNNGVIGHQQPQPEVEACCLEHGKPVQGFCKECKHVLCIECILSGVHRNHEICAVE